nr:keratin-associated protein 10-1-like [Nothobranchius furzeri]
MEAADPGATRELHPLRTPSFSGVVGLVSPLFSCFPAPKPLPETQLIVPCTCSDRLSSTCRRAGFPRIAPAVCPLPGPRCGAYACRFRAAAASAGSHACSCSSLPGSHAYCCSPCRVPRLLLQPLPGPTPTAAAPAGSHANCCSSIPGSHACSCSSLPGFHACSCSSLPGFHACSSPVHVPVLSSPVKSMFQSCPVPVQSPSPRPVSESPSSLRVPVQSLSSLLCRVALWASGIRP